MSVPADMMAVHSFFLFLFGIILGSFGNVLICRLPQEETIGGRSMCPQCKKKIALYDNIPLLSYLILRGRCRNCKKKISIQYPFVELVTGLLFVSTTLVHMDILSQALLAVCLWLLFLIAVIDAKVQGIPDALNIPFVLVAGLYAFQAGIFDWWSLAIGLGFLGGQWILSMGKWVGSGDLILIVGIGFMVGIWPKMIMCLLLAYIIGALVASILLLTGIKSRKDALAFAPFLSASAAITVFYGQWILMYLF